LILCPFAWAKTKRFVSVSIDFLKYFKRQQAEKEHLLLIPFFMTRCDYISSYLFDIPADFTFFCCHQARTGAKISTTGSYIEQGGRNKAHVKFLGMRTGLEPGQPHVYGQSGPGCHVGVKTLFKEFCTNKREFKAINWVE
jgi:hypothetical protein